MPPEEHADAVWIDSSYENVRAECPSCRRESIFNRRSDLNSTSPIVRMTVECLREECNTSFAIIGDSVNEAFAMLVFDTHSLIDGKRYMPAILNLAQAHEVFFSTWLRVVLAYRPYAHDLTQGAGQLNARLHDLFNTTKTLSFRRLRAVFLRLVLRDTPLTLVDASGVIAEIPHLVDEPSDSEVGSCEDPKLRSLLHKIKSSTIHELRNRVVHQSAYRPSREEAVDALRTTRQTLFGLATRLDVHDDPNWYVHQRDRGQR